jgi:hypothetical protein
MCYQHNRWQISTLFFFVAITAACPLTVPRRSDEQPTRRLIPLEAAPGKSTTGSQQGKITGRR